MKKILVANQKGGCGKTMVSITLAAALANKLADKGETIAIADADPQQSTLSWLKRRPDTATKILELDWRRLEDIGEKPKGIDWLIIDAPGALKGKHAQQLIAESKAIITPVLPSMFDVESTKRFLSNIDEIKRVRKGKVKQYLLANRVRTQSINSQHLKDFFENLGQQPLGWITERSAYPQLAMEGLSIFDKTQKAFEPMQNQWQPVLDALLEK